MRSFQIALAIAIGAVIFSAFIMLVNGDAFWHTMGEIHNAFGELFHLVINGISILFFVGLVLGSAWIIWRFKQESGVIRPDKYGAPVAIRHQGQVIQLSEASATMDPMQQVVFMQKMLQLTNVVNKQMNYYGNADDEEYEEDEEDEQLQIAAPAKKMYPLLDLMSSGDVDNDLSVIGYRSEDGSAVQGKLFDLEKNIYNSVFTVGDQGYGKSAFATLIAAYTVRRGGHLLIIDPEMGQPQSLTERLGPLVNPAFLLTPVANTPEKADALLSIAEAKMKNPDGTPLLLIVDELSMIARSAEANMGEWKDVGKRVLFVCEEFATRGRKRLQRAIVMGQFVQGKRNGGTTLLYSMATMVFHLKKRQSKWALDNEDASQTEALIRGEVMIIPSDSEEEQTRMQVIYPDEQALTIIAQQALQARTVGSLGTTFNNELDDFEELSGFSPQSPNTAFPGPSSRTTGNLENTVKALEKVDESIPQFSEEEERQVLQIARAQIATIGRVVRSKIPEAMNPKRNNAFYPVIKYICDREGW